MITTKDYKVRRVAKKLLQLSTHPAYKFSAVLVRAGNVIKWGVNKGHSRPKFYTTPLPYIHFLHAEVACLHNVSKEQAKNATIYVFGETVEGTLTLTRPCAMCRELIERMGVRRIVYQNPDGSLDEINLIVDE